MATVINGDTAGVHTSAAVECLQLITTNYTISSGYNAGFFGPVTVDTGVSIVIPDGATLTVV
jgi:hypothetical protein